MVNPNKQPRKDNLVIPCLKLVYMVNDYKILNSCTFVYYSLVDVFCFIMDSQSIGQGVYRSTVSNERQKLQNSYERALIYSS